MKDTIDCAKEGVSGRKSPVEVLRGGGKGLQGMPKVGYTIGARGIARSRTEAGPTCVMAYRLYRQIVPVTGLTKW